MKRQWHIRTRVLVTLIGLTCAILLAVALAFNLSVRSYIRSRVTAQLETTAESVAQDRRDDPKGNHSGKHFDEHADRITGTKSSALVLGADGTIKNNLHGQQETAEALSAYFAERGIDETIRYRVVRLEGGSYALSVQDDPVQSGDYLVSYVDVTALTALTTRVNLVLLAIILAAIALSVLLSRRIARSFAAPVQTLSEFAQGIGEGDLEPRVLRFRDLEFDQLAGSMNRMVTALDESNRKQAVFFQNVSHELRTPLTAIRGNAEGIVCGVMEPEAAGKVILAQSDRLGSMVEDILYLSRMGRGLPEGQAQPLDLRELLSLCVSEQRLEAENRGLGFAFDFDEAPVLLPIRETDAQRLFGNLISNAIRYAKSTIRLTCRTENNSVRVAVADDGPGIAPEDLPHVFERFYKGADGKHGIGLSIAKAVAEAYRGTLEARNEGGAVFEACFPIEA